MNPINKAVMNLKDDARAAGREAAKENGTRAQDRALIGAYGRNVKAAHEGAQKFGWWGTAMALILNEETNKAFTKASGRTIEGWDNPEDED
jgi:hypothetical protein